MHVPRHTPLGESLAAHWVMHNYHDRHCIRLARVLSWQDMHNVTQPRKNNGRRHQGAGDVGYGERLVCSKCAQAMRILLARLSASNFRAQRHDSGLILACQLRQLNRLALVEHLPGSVSVLPVMMYAGHVPH